MRNGLPQLGASEPSSHDEQGRFTVSPVHGSAGFSDELGRDLTLQRVTLTTDEEDMFPAASYARDCSW